MTEPIAERIGREVRAEIEQRGITHRALGELLGLPQTSVTRRILGKVEFRPSELEKIAEHLGLTVRHFVPEDAPAVTS